MTNHPGLTRFPVGTPISSHRKRLEMSSGALASSRSIAARPSRKCFQPS